LSVSGGDFLTVKKELNAGEGLDLQAVQGDRTLAAILAYLVGWSFVGADDQPLPYHPMQSIEERRATLCNLDTATMDEIIDALGPHMLAARRAVEEKKTTPLPVTA